MFNLTHPRSRRDFLRIGSLALGGLVLPRLLANRARAAGQHHYARDRSVVLLFLQGGPPQVETFDPKPDSTEKIRSITGHIPTTLPGVRFGATLPKLAKLAKQFAVVRSFGVGGGGLSHEAGYQRLLQAGNPFEAVMGSLYARTVGSLNSRTTVPTNSLLLPEAIDADLRLGKPSGAFTLKQTLRYFATAGKLGAPFEPFQPNGGSQLIRNLTLQIAPDRFDDRKLLLSNLDGLKRRLDRTRELDGVGGFYQQAYDVLVKGISEAFDLSKEDPRTVEKYDTSRLFSMETHHRGGKKYKPNYSRSTNLLGKQMLLARRLCEAGCGFVTVVDSCWDFHADGNNPPVLDGMNALSPQFDHAVSAFLEDVEQRGLSDKILLVVTGEMGRSSSKKGKGGTGHWGELTPLLLAGGGLKTGQVIGRSDSKGMKPASRSFSPSNLLATIMNQLLDVNEVRVADDLPKTLVETLTETEPIEGLH